MISFPFLFQVIEPTTDHAFQPVGAHVEGAIELHNIYLGPDNLYRAQRRSSRLTTTGYHSDVSYEHQPPGITILTILAVPSTGGDTGWVSQVAAYERLSEPIKKLLEGLRAEHFGYPQAENARRDGKFVRREPVKSERPIVRIHPVRSPLLHSSSTTNIRTRQQATKPSSSTRASRRRSSVLMMRNLMRCSSSCSSI